MRPLLLALAPTLFAAGCQLPTCQDTCRRYYDQDQCDAAPAGANRDAVVDECVSLCKSALDVPGEEPEPNDPRFDPNRIPNTRKPTLDNERDAAAWMECVWSVDDESCHELERYCARVP